MAVRLNVEPHSDDARKLIGPGCAHRLPRTAPGSQDSLEQALLHSQVQYRTYVDGFLVPSVGIVSRHLHDLGDG